MRIGELSSRTGASARSLRYYEQQGLLSSERSAGGQRHYGEAAVERVAFVRRLYAAGLSSRTIVDLMPCVDAPDEDHRGVALERLTRERARLADHIAELARTMDSLDALLANARGEQECEDPNAPARHGGRLVFRGPREPRRSHPPTSTRAVSEHSVTGSGS